MLKGHWRLLLRVLPTRSSDPALSSARNIAARCSSSSTQTYTLTGNKQRGIWKKVAWTGAAALVGGGGYVGYILTPDWRQITDSRHYYSDWKLRAYFSLPLNALSMVAGGVASCQVPTFLRHPLYSSFASVYEVDMGEAAEEDLTKYPTFASFFNRSLKEGVRPISSSPLVSPADGVVLHFGKIEEDRVEYVKGHDYDFKDFCGPVNSERQPDMDLYQLVIYLAPGDYHGFHSPTRWVASQAVHQPGLLLSVRPWVLERVPHLLCLNERIVINGTWRHGFFSMAAVAATNVGDIAIDADPLLRTNVSRRAHNGERRVTELHHPYTVGERVGEFRLGSTIVLVFEGPPTLRWAINAGDKLRYGQSLILS